MPSLGADMEAGTLVEWMVKPGDRVKRGDIVAVVETQKGAIEIEIFETGRVEQMLVEVGAKVPVGTPLARIRAEQESAPGFAAMPRPAEVAPPLPLRLPRRACRRRRRPTTYGRGRRGGRMRASPAARQLASVRGIDLSAVTGSGPLGAILRADIERSAAAVTAPAEKKRSIGLDLEGNARRDRRGDGAVET